MKEENNITTKNVKISFCLPVYNVKPFLEDCLQSIVNQNIDEYEILCIDDGSTDGSYEFLFDKMNVISKLKVLKNEVNKGVSYTRNRLMKEAKGEYIWFVDPDDMLYPFVVSAFIDIAERENGDVVLGNYVKIGETKTYEEKEKIDASKIEYYTPKFENWEWLPDKNGESKMFSLCRGIFKRDFLIKNELFLNEKVVLMEDALLYYEMRLKKPKIVKMEVCCYQVRQRAGSAMRSAGYNLNRSIKQYESLEELIRVYKKYAYSSINVELESEKRMKFLFKTSIFALAKIKDRKYIQGKLRGMKARKEYPQMLKILEGSSFVEKVLLILFRFPICIFIFNGVYQLKK